MHIYVYMYIFIYMCVCAAYMLTCGYTSPPSYNIWPGRITLRSADPFDAPLIDPNYLADKSDVETLTAALKVMSVI